MIFVGTRSCQLQVLKLVFFNWSVRVFIYDCVLCNAYGGSDLNLYLYLLGWYFLYGSLFLFQTLWAMCFLRLLVSIQSIFEMPLLVWYWSLILWLYAFGKWLWCFIVWRIFSSKCSSLVVLVGRARYVFFLIERALNMLIFRNLTLHFFIYIDR